MSVSRFGSVNSVESIQSVFSVRNLKAFSNQIFGARVFRDKLAGSWGSPLPRISTPRGLHLEATWTIKFQAANISAPSLLVTIEV